MDITDRLNSFINYKTGGSRIRLAEMMGWTRQYLNNLLVGKSFGLRPIEALLMKFPELDARWLILGEGDMIRKEYVERERENVLSRIKEIEAIIPYLSPEQVARVNNGEVLTDEEIKMVKAGMDT